MTSHRLLVHLAGLSLIVAACSSDDKPDVGSASGGKVGSGGGNGSQTGGAPGTGSGGAVGTGGATGTGGSDGSGGQPGSGGAAPATGTGGVNSGGATAGTGQGGSNAGATGTGSGGSTGAGGGPSGWPYPMKNPPVPSAGCGKPATITSSKYPAYRTIMSGGDSRQYVIDLPASYDMNHPYRFVMGSHGQGGEGNDIQREKYYSLQNIADAASSVIFVSASGLGGSWGLKDVPLFDDILDFVKKGACVDESRVFVLGFSFGGMYSYSLSMTRQKTIRAGIGMSPANFNIQIPTKSHDPIAWMQSTGMSDGTCPWVSNEAQMRGSKFIAIEHGTDNGCMVPNPIPTWTSGGILCNDFAGCRAGFPTRVCTFNGGHGLPPSSSTWMWQFISQF